MLPSSKLLPMTITGLVAILSLRTYALATTTPSPALLRAGAEQALVAVGSTAAAGVITQAHAAGAPPAARSSAPAVKAPAIPVTAAGTRDPAPEAAGPVRTAPVPRPDPFNGPELPAAPTQAVPPPLQPAAAAPAPVLPVAETVLADRAVLNGARPAADQASELIQREATIMAAEKRLNERVGELQGLQQRLQGLDASLKERDAANWTGLVKLYEGMKPREAAGIFNSLEKPVLIEILDRMKAAKASPILAAMDAERARQITADLAARRVGSTTAGVEPPSRTAAAAPDGTATN